MDKTALIDIETFPILGWTWKKFDTNIIKSVRSTEIACFAYKWFDEKEIIWYGRDAHSEKFVLNQLHKVLSDADIVIAQNGKAFDVKKINYRMQVHNMKPPSPYRIIDTKTEIKKVAEYDSHSLDNMAHDLDEGKKVENRGFPMWEGCMGGNQQDWLDMKRYNMGDVSLLESIYKRQRPWYKNSPRVTFNRLDCPVCGSPNSQKRGMSRTLANRYQRYQCECGHWFQGEKIK